MMLPLTAISTLDDEEFAPPAIEYYDDPVEQEVSPAFNRQRVAQGFTDLMGGEVDADGVAADLIDTGSDLVLWGLSSSPDALAIVPDLGDWTDPEAWLDKLDELDLPGDLELAVERLARGAARRMDLEGEESVRRQFAARLGDLLRDAGLEALAVRGREGQDWIVLNAQDLARESDGEPWAPPGGYTASLDLRDLGVSLGQGGRVRLWPTDVEEPPVAPPSPIEKPDERAASPPPAPPAAPPPPPPPSPPAPPARARRGGSGLTS